MARTTTAAMIARVRRGTTSVIEARVLGGPYGGRCPGTDGLAVVVAAAAPEADPFASAGAEATAGFAPVADVPGGVGGLGGAAGEPVAAAAGVAVEAAAAPAATAGVFALRTERRAPRSRSRAPSPVSPGPGDCFDGFAALGPGTRLTRGSVVGAGGMAMIWVESTGAGAGTAGALTTALSSARAPASSSRCSGSRSSSP